MRILTIVKSNKITEVAKNGKSTKNSSDCTLGKLTINFRRKTSVKKK